MDLKGQVAIVTGASQGIGRAIAELLGRNGASVLINYVGDDSHAEDTVKTIESYGSKACAYKADIGKVSNISRMFELCIEKLGRPDILVANAGAMFPPKPLEEVTEEDFYFIYDVNVKGTLFCLKEAKKHLNNDGRIVVISSSTVRYPVEGMTVYTSSKAALLLLVEDAVPEMAQRGITINTVMPGLTLTPSSVAGLSPEFMKHVEQTAPFKRLGQPQDVAEVVGFLCEKRSYWISGQHIIANGGSQF